MSAVPIRRLQSIASITGTYALSTIPPFIITLFVHSVSLQCPFLGSLGRHRSALISPILLASSFRMLTTCSCCRMLKSSPFQPLHWPFCALYCVFQLAGRSGEFDHLDFLAWPCGLHSYGRICVHGFIFFTGTCVPFQLLNIPLIQAHGMRFVLVFLTI